MINVSLSARSLALFGIVFVPVLAALITLAACADAATPRRGCTFENGPNGTTIIICPRPKVQ